MSATAVAINLSVAALLVLAVLLALGLCRAAGRPYPAKETRGQRVWDEAAERWTRLPYGVKPGPGQLTEREVNARDRYQLLISELEADPLDPKWDAGCARLLAAIRDEQNNQKGDQL